MRVIYSYLVKNGTGEHLEDEVYIGDTYKDRDSAELALIKMGYSKIDDKNYEKQLDTTLYQLATLIGEANTTNIHMA